MNQPLKKKVVTMSAVQLPDLIALCDVVNVCAVAGLIYEERGHTKYYEECYREAEELSTELNSFIREWDLDCLAERAVLLIR